MNLIETEPMNGTCLSSTVEEDQPVTEAPVVVVPTKSKKVKTEPADSGVKKQRSKKVNKKEGKIETPQRKFNFFQLEENVKLYIDLLNLKEKTDALPDSELKTFLSSEFNEYIEFLQTYRKQ